MAESAHHLGFSVTAFRFIGLAELSGVAGITAGLWWATLGVAAAAGMTALTIGAAVTHRRTGDEPKALVPAFVLGTLAAIVLVLRLRGPEAMAR